MLSILCGMAEDDLVAHCHICFEKDLLSVVYKYFLYVVYESYIPIAESYGTQMTLRLSIAFASNLGCYQSFEVVGATKYSEVRQLPTYNHISSTSQSVLRATY